MYYEDDPRIESSPALKKDGKEEAVSNVLDNRRTAEAASRLSYINGCSLFNRNP